MKSSIPISALVLVLVAFPLVSADKSITKDSSACDLKKELYYRIKIIELAIKLTPGLMPKWVRTRGVPSGHETYCQWSDSRTHCNFRVLVSHFGTRDIWD